MLRIPGIYIAVLVPAAVVLAFVLEFVAFVLHLMRTPAASVDERSYPKLERRVLVRLAAVGGVAAFAVTVSYVAYPDLLKPVVMRLLNYPSLLLPAGAALYIVALLCGVKPRQPVLLVSLALPGLAIMPLLTLLDFVRSNDVIESLAGVFIVFVIQPAYWILLSIGVGQARQLRKRGGDFTVGGLVRVCLITIAYVYGFII